MSMLVLVLVLLVFVDVDCDVDVGGVGVVVNVGVDVVLGVGVDVDVDVDVDVQFDVVDGGVDDRSMSLLMFFVLALTFPLNLTSWLFMLRLVMLFVWCR